MASQVNFGDMSSVTYTQEKLRRIALAFLHMEDAETAVVSHTSNLHIYAISANTTLVEAGRLGGSQV